MSELGTQLATAVPSTMRAHNSVHGVVHFDEPKREGDTIWVTWMCAGEERTDRFELARAASGSWVLR